jgi:hypothetical protein
VGCLTLVRIPAQAHTIEISWVPYSCDVLPVKRNLFYYIHLSLVIHCLQWMLHNFCEFATDYPSLLRTFKDPIQISASSRIVQFPFTLPVIEERTEEELARITERKKEQGRKLQEMAAKVRLEKVRIEIFLNPWLFSICFHNSWYKRKAISNI